MKKKNKKVDPEDYTEQCKTCEFLPNCLGWYDKTVCQDWMRKYFQEHPEARINPNDPV